MMLHAVNSMQVHGSLVAISCERKVPDTHGDCSTVNVSSVTIAQKLTKSKHRNTTGVSSLLVDAQAPTKADDTRRNSTSLLNENVALHIFPWRK